MTPTFFVISLTSALTSAVERASSLASVARLMPFSFFTSTSVAITLAPSAAKACAIARPIPCPAAVTSATLPLSLPAKLILPAAFSKLLYQIDADAVTKVLGAFRLVAMAPVPRNVEGKLLSGIEADAGTADCARACLGKSQHDVADAASLRRRRHRHAPDQQIVRTRLEDQHAIEAGTFGKPDLV